MQSNTNISAQIQYVGGEEGVITFKVTRPETYIFMCFDLSFNKQNMLDWVKLASGVKNKHTFRLNSIMVIWNENYANFRMSETNGTSVIMECIIPRSQAEEALRLGLLEAMNRGQLSLSFNCV